MAINTQKVIVGGVAAGVAVGVVEYVLNGILLAEQNDAAMNALSPDIAGNLAGGAFIVGALVIALLLGVNSMGNAGCRPHREGLLSHGMSMICGELLQQPQQMKCYTIGISVPWHGFCRVGHTRRRVGVCQTKVTCTGRYKCTEEEHNKTEHSIYAYKSHHTLTYHYVFCTFMMTHLHI